MGYFSNGSEGDGYYSALCANCVHDENEDCPVWGLHLMHNYEGANDKNHFLHWFIPRNEDGTNGNCKMFVRRDA